MKNKMPQWLRNEWEKVVFVAALAILLLLVGATLGRHSTGDDYRAVSQTPLQYKPMIADHSWKFLRDPLKVSMPERDAFHWEYAAPKPAKTADKDKKTPPPPPPKTVETQEETTANLAEPVAMPPLAQPEERPTQVPGIVKFTFQGKDRTGKSIAILSWRRRGQGGLAKTVTLGVGDETSGLKVVGISEEEVLAIDARGRRVRIKLQQETPVWLDSK